MTDNPQRTGIDVNRRQFLRTTTVAGVGFAGISAASQSVDANLTCDLVVDNDGGADHETIQGAVDAADEGDTICVNEGVYTEYVNIGKPITLVGDPGNSNPGAGTNAPKLDGGNEPQSAAFALYNDGAATDVTIEGFEIHNYGIRPGEWGTGVQPAPGCANIVVRNNTIHDMGSAGVGVQGENFVVENNHFERIGRVSINVTPVSGARIANNVIKGGQAQTSDETFDDYASDRWSNTGITLHGSGGQEDRTVSENILVEANQIEGPMDEAGVKLIANNRNTKDGASLTMRDVTVRDNTVQNVYGAESTAGRAYRATASSSGAAVQITDVEYIGNTAVDNEVGFFLGSSFDTGITNVTYTNNHADAVDQGFVIGTVGQGAISDVVYQHNRLTNINGNGYWVRADQNRIENVSYTDCTVTGAHIGTRVQTFGGTIRDVTFENGEISDGTFGIAFVGTNGRVENVSLQRSAVESNTVGVVFAAKDPDGEIESALVEKCKIRENGWGVSVQPGVPSGAVLTRNCQIESNKTGVICLDGAIPTAIDVHNNNIVGNSEYGIRNRSEEGTLPATCNWWGDPRGPVAPDNTAGEGDTVSANVDYDPWLPQRFERVDENACHVGEGNKTNGASTGSASE